MKDKFEEWLNKHPLSSRTNQALRCYLWEEGLKPSAFNIRNIDFRKISRFKNFGKKSMLELWTAIHGEKPVTKYCKYCGQSLPLKNLIKRHR